MILERLKDIFAEELGMSRDEFTLDFNFRESDRVDSLDFVQAVMTIEEEFGIELPEDLSNVNTVEDLVEVISKLTDGE